MTAGNIERSLSGLVRQVNVAVRRQADGAVANAVYASVDGAVDGTATGDRCNGDGLILRPVTPHDTDWQPCPGCTNCQGNDDPDDHHTSRTIQQLPRR